MFTIFDKDELNFIIFSKFDIFLKHSRSKAGYVLKNIVNRNKKWSFYRPHPSLEFCCFSAQSGFVLCQSFGMRAHHGIGFCISCAPASVFRCNFVQLFLLSVEWCNSADFTAEKTKRDTTSSDIKKKSFKQPLQMFSLDIATLQIIWGLIVHPSVGLSVAHVCQIMHCALAETLKKDPYWSRLW